MDTNECQQQLQAINQMLENCAEGSAKDELLSLKQNIEELVSLTGETTQHSQQPDEENKEVEDEYGLFMAEMAKEGALSSQPDESDDASTINKLKSCKELEGKKFKAPHKHQWGQVAYHNAMICSVPENISSDGEFEVKVLFLNPTHKEMLPCPYYFDVERDCNFSEDKCHYSHGELVPFSSLQDYIEPKFENLVKGSMVLAKQSNNLWYRAKIAHISDGTCLVKFDSKNRENKNFEEVAFENILPLTNSEDQHDSGDKSDSERDDNPLEVDNTAEKERSDIINMSLMNVPDSQVLGEWEKYTKGIGSKLMKKMGYIVGTGLGKDGSGIIKPITALVLPPGKSLDFCMNLKERKNKPDLFSAERKATVLQRKIEMKQRKLEKKEGKKKRKQMDVCEFINFTLKLKTSKKVEAVHIRELRRKLKSSSEKELNIANLTVEGSIKKQITEIENLRRLLTNVFEQTSSQSNNVAQRLQEEEHNLKNLQKQALFIQEEMKTRKNQKEMTVF